MARVPSARVASVAAAAVLGDLDPGGVAVDGPEGLRGNVVAAQPGCEHMVEPRSGDRFDVVRGYEAPVSDHADAADREPVGEVFEHRRQGGGVVCVAGEHVVRDGDPVGGAQQADHDLGPVRPVVARVPERPGREPPRRRCRPLEVGGGHVIAHQPQIQVRQIAKPRVQVLLGRLLSVGDRVEGPIELIQRRRRPALGHDHIAAGPLDEATLRARRHQPVRHHREHRVLQRRRAPPPAHRSEEPAQTQPLPHRRHRRDRAHSRRPLRGQRPDIDTLLVQMRLQRGHDPLQLARLAQSRHLPQTQQGPVTDLGAVANRLHQRQVLVHLVAPATTCRLHEHTTTITSTTHAVKYVSPLQIPTQTPPRDTKPHVNGHQRPPKPHQPAKLGSVIPLP